VSICFSDEHVPNYYLVYTLLCHPKRFCNTSLGLCLAGNRSELQPSEVWFLRGKEFSRLHLSTLLDDLSRRRNASHRRRNSFVFCTQRDIILRFEGTHYSRVCLSKQIAHAARNLNGQDAKFGVSEIAN